MQRLLRKSFAVGLSINARLTQHPWGRVVESRVLTPLFVQLTRWIRGRPPTPVGLAPDALGREWERLLGDTRFARVTKVDAETQTAYGEITGRCPLRGSSDVAACHRLMAYDRKLMAPLGARFVVLRSQAEPGRTCCEVAIRPDSMGAEDLVAAHLRVSAERP